MTRPIPDDVPPPGDAWTWIQAAGCYELAGQPAEAARCFMRAGQFTRAAHLYQRAGLLRAAAQAWLSAGAPERAAWILVHDVDDVTEARACLLHRSTSQVPALVSDDTRLVRRLVEARCAIAEGAPADLVLPLLREVRSRLAEGSERLPQSEQWAVAIAETICRFDQVALLYAGAVQGGDVSAGSRWTQWAQRRFGQSILLPPPERAAFTGRSAS